MSADIVGSTAFKQPFNFDTDLPERSMIEGGGKKRDGTPKKPWSDIIQGFYSKSSSAVSRHWNVFEAALVSEGLSSKTAEWLGPQPKLWKTVGDEVIFWKELTDDVQIATSLACWVKVAHEIRSWLQDDEETQLDVKCTAWLAEFPVRNRAVWSEYYSSTPLKAVDGPLLDSYASPEKAETTVTDSLKSDVAEPAKSDSALLQLNNFYDNDAYLGSVDFIGPGIDTGFRISQWSSSRHFIISLDVAYLLALVKVGELNSSKPLDALSAKIGKSWFSTAGTQDTALLDVYFAEPEYVKGVIGGLSYPKFWLNIKHKSDSLILLESQLHTQQLKPAIPARVRDYCKAFYRERSNYLIKPFINNVNSITQPHVRYSEFLDVVAIRRP